MCAFPLGFVVGKFRLFSLEKSSDFSSEF
jgi:hypothetical protein